MLCFQEDVKRQIVDYNLLPNKHFHESIESFDEVNIIKVNFPPNSFRL